MNTTLDILTLAAIFIAGGGAGLMVGALCASRKCDECELDHFRYGPNFPTDDATFTTPQSVIKDPARNSVRVALADSDTVSSRCSHSTGSASPQSAVEGHMNMMRCLHGNTICAACGAWFETDNNDYCHKCRENLEDGK